MGRLTIIY